jgi:hypothetical protein
MPHTTNNTSSASSRSSLSLRSSANSVADLMRFEAALEQILPDLDSTIGVGEIDKELFEKFVMGSDGERARNSREGSLCSPLSKTLWSKQI